MLFPERHKSFLEARRGLYPALGIPRGHHATLAGIVPDERDLADPEEFELTGRPKKPILPKWFNPAEFEVAAESAPRASERQLWKPASDFLQASFTDDRWTGCRPIIRKPIDRIADKLNGESEEVT